MTDSSATAVADDPSSRSSSGDGGDSRTAVLRPLIDHRHDIGLSTRRLAQIVVVAVVASIAQAGALVFIVRLATALTAGSTGIDGSISFLSVSDLSRSQVFAITLGLVLVTFLLELLLGWLLSAFQEQAHRRTQKQLLAALSSAPLDAQLDRSRGDMQQVLFNHTAQVSRVVGAFGKGVASLTSFLVLVGSSLVLSPLAAVVVAVGMFVVLAGVRPVVRASRTASRLRATEQRTLGAEIAERLELTREVAAFGVGEAYDDLLGARVDRVARLARRRGTLNSAGGAVYRVGGLLIVLAALWLLDRLELDNLTALTGALLILLRSMSYGQAAQATYQTISDGIPVLEQLNDEMARLSAGGRSQSSSGAEPKQVGAITFDHVSFSYPDGVRALSDVSFRIEPGELVGLVGPSGAGKSTAMQLILGARAATEGTVSFGSSDITTIRDGWLRRHVALVPQESRLRSGSMADSIRFLRNELSDDAIAEAADRAHIGGDVRRLSDGLETQVGQLGEDLSGGQRQRVAIARALAGQPGLLLLDEPTSALDAGAIAEVVRTIEELRGEMTIVVIAHRPETIEHADRLLVFDDGRVTEIPRPRPDQLHDVLFSTGEASGSPGGTHGSSSG